MKTFLAGATGATGSLLLKMLLKQGHQVVAVVRSKERVPQEVRNNPNVQLVEANLLDMDDAQLQELLIGCQAIGVCLGHNLNFKGIYGKPRKLVRDAVVKLCKASDPEQDIRFVLMNTSGNRNKERNEKVSFGHRLVVGLLRLILPPHPDNEQAARHLQYKIGKQHANIQWVAVRPDGLIDQDEVTPYTIYPSPTRDPIFNAGKTSRINVADFMAELMSGGPLWNQWKYELPVIYNREQ